MESLSNSEDGTIMGMLFSAILDLMKSETKFLVIANFAQP